MPIIMLTAKGDDMDKILGLEYGADDYITKPFNILEVKARIKAIIRRNNKKNGGAKRQESSVVTEGDLKLDRESRRVFIKDKEINLTAKEFDLLELLVTNPNKVYSRETLLEYVWGNKAMVNGDVRTVDVHVRRLREKIEPSPSDPKYVHTSGAWGTSFAHSVSVHSNEQCRDSSHNFCVVLAQKQKLHPGPIGRMPAGPESGLARFRSHCR